MISPIELKLYTEKNIFVKGKIAMPRRGG